MRLTFDDPLPPEDWAGYGRGCEIDALYRAHSGRLTRFFARRAASEDVADLVHETFRRLIGRMRDDRPPIETPEAWLSRVAANLLVDRNRRARFRGTHEAFDEEDIDGIDPHGALEARDVAARADAALLELPELTRDIFLLHRLGGHSYSEIAVARGLTVKSVERHMAKALLRLRQRLSPDG